MKSTFIQRKNFQVTWVVHLFPRSIILSDLYNDSRSQFGSACAAIPLITGAIQHNLLTSVLGGAALGEAFYML